jgi:hypothetical protein
MSEHMGAHVHSVASSCFWTVIWVSRDSLVVLFDWRWVQFYIKDLTENIKYHNPRNMHIWYSNRNKKTQSRLWSTPTEAKTPSSSTLTPPRLSHLVARRWVTPTRISRSSPLSTMADRLKMRWHRQAGHRAWSSCPWILESTTKQSYDV